MRSALMMLVAALIAAFIGANAEAGEVQPVQAPDSAAATSAHAAVDSAAAQAAPATAAGNPTMLKMAMVPPPADFEIPAGYRSVQRALDTVYCTSIKPVGSRIPQTFCLTRDQLKDQQRQAEVARRELAQKSHIAGSGGGG